VVVVVLLLLFGRHAPSTAAQQLKTASPGCFVLLASSWSAGGTTLGT